MSHLRNLFHKTSGPKPVAQPSTPAYTGHTLVQDSSVLTASVPLPEFQTEEAYMCPEHRLVFHTDPRSPAADRIRLLRMRLKDRWKTGQLKKLLITSPLAGDGKSTLTLNLATALHERGKHTVLVVEADLHHSTISEILRLRPWTGITECLTAESVSPFSSVRQIQPFGWHLLPAGEPRRNPTELLQSPAFGRMLQQLAPCFDWILIDSPPVIPLTDSISLQQHVDASLLVVRAGQTPRESIEHTLDLLGKKNILGVVLNGVQTRDHLYYQYYGRPSAHADD